MPEANYYGILPSNVKDVENRYRYVATSGQTTFAANYAAGFVDVYVNGLKLDPGAAFTAVDKVSVVLTAGATTGSVVEIISKRQVQVLNSGVDTFANPVQFTATAGQTSFALSYAAGAIMLVTRNGLDVAFTASNGTSVVLSVAASLNDVVKVYVTSKFSVANTLPAAGGTATGPITLAAGGTSTTPATADNSTNIATTAYTRNLVASNPGGFITSSGSITGNAASANTAVASTTRLITDNTTNIATTAFVQAFFPAYSVGYYQTQQNVTGSRVSGTTYYNTTTRPISAFMYSAVGSSGSVSGYINGNLVMQQSSGTGQILAVTLPVIPVGASYQMTSTAAFNAWWEQS